MFELLLFLIILSISFVKLSLAEEWEVKDGVTVQRYCLGSEVRYSTSAPKGFELCLSQESKGSFNKMTTTSNIIQKDFSDGKEASEMSAEERKQMARDLRAIQDRRDKEAPQDLLKELNKIVRSWQSDPKFREEIMKSLTPEERKLLQQLPAPYTELIKGVLGPNSRKK